MRPGLFWPGRDPIGARATIVAPGAPSAPLQIVGIVANVRRSDVDARVMPQVYVPSTWKQERAMTIVVRTDATDPLGSVNTIRAQAAALEPNEPLFAVASMEQVIFSDMASTYTLAGLARCDRDRRALPGGSGHLRCRVVHGHPANARDRTANGARGTTRVMLRMVIRQASQPVAGGGLLGAPAAFALVYAMSGVFAAVDVRDPTNYIGVALSIRSSRWSPLCAGTARGRKINPLNVTELRQ